VINGEPAVSDKFFRFLSTPKRRRKRVTELAVKPTVAEAQATVVESFPATGVTMFSPAVRQREYCPSLEEISAATKIIRAGWTETERYNRARGITPDRAAQKGQRIARSTQKAESKRPPIQVADDFLSTLMEIL